MAFCRCGDLVLFSSKLHTEVNNNVYFVDILSGRGGDVKQSEFRRWLESQGVDASEWPQPFETQVSWEAQCHAASLLRKSNPGNNSV